MERNEDSNVAHFMDEFGRLMNKTDLDNNEVLSMYDSFAETYEKEMVDINFSSADLTVKYFLKHAQRLNISKDCRILDVGAGTGNVGQLLKVKHGYKNLDALDPSEPMLEKARQKNVYQNVFVGKVGGGHTIPAENDVYDAVLVSGSLVPGHMKYDAFLDIQRVLKPGGICVNTMREQFTWDHEECYIRVPFSQWQVEGRWDILEWAIPDTEYLSGKDALVHVYRKPQKSGH